MSETRLAVYGSLAPGEVNHHQLAGLPGTWRPGTVRGNRFDRGWGSGLGFPALVLDPAGPAVDVQIFESADLPDHWAWLDEFEGDGYQRAAIRLLPGGGQKSGICFALAYLKRTR